MKPKQALIRLFMVSLLCLLLPATGLSETSAQAGPSGELFLPSDNAMADVEQAMHSALANNRLVLVVMGANWCHDSRALASRLYQEPLGSLIEDRYETVFVDVGYLDKGREVISSIGPPVYYATPTVLIIDPVSGQLVNADNRHQWGSADTISMEESVDYFQLMAEANRKQMRLDQQATGELLELLNEIDGFEQTQAERLYSAYRVIGPMLHAYKEGNSPEQFDDYWNQVRSFRMKVPIDIDALREEAYRRTAADEVNIQLEYPRYAAFSWEESHPDD
jgi:hypothetical protein